MTEFCVVGSADDTEFAKCEYLACYLHKNLPSFTCHISSVLPAQWQSYVESLAVVHKFTRLQRVSPVVYTQQGKLIGSAAEFFSLVRLVCS